MEAIGVDGICYSDNDCQSTQECVPFKGNFFRTNCLKKVIMDFFAKFLYLFSKDVILETEVLLDK